MRAVLKKSMQIGSQSAEDQGQMLSELSAVEDELAEVGWRTVLSTNLTEG